MRSMKHSLLFLLIFSVTIPVNLVCLEQAAIRSEKTSNSVQNFDTILNLDELEEEMVKMNIIDSIKPIPPHPLIVWVRIIGLPMANAYFAVRRIVRTSLHKVATLLKLKTAKNEELI